jgi:hypothetical protein
MGVSGDDMDLLTRNGDKDIVTLILIPRTRPACLIGGFTCPLTQQ